MNIGNIDMNGGYLGSEEVIKCYQGNTVVWEQSSGSPIDYSTMPLTFQITGDGIINWKCGATGITKTLEYSKNGGDWTSITSATGTSAPSISVVSGDIIQFRGDNATYGGSAAKAWCNFTGTTCEFNIYGNIMSLIDSVNFSGLTTLSTANNYVFKSLFSNCTGLTDVSNLLLPATTLSNNCYQAMFQGCTSLTTAPALSAATLANDCYYGMFGGCTSLTTAPALPATTLANACYQQMFKGCTSLTTAPELPTTTLSNNCYYQMFYGCTGLTQAPELPATTLTSGCYRQMFINCTALNYIKCFATNISATYCTQNWVDGVAASGTFVTPSTTNWSTDTSGIPTNWRRVNSDIPQYTQLEYIQTNFEYFNTQIVPDSNIKVVLDFELTSFDGGYGNNGIFGSWTNGYDGSDTLAFFANSDRSEFSYYCGGGFEDFAGEYTVGNRYTVELDGNECVITEDGGIPQQFVIGLTVSQGTTPILLGCVYPNPDDNPEPTNIKIYEGWIYNGNTLIAHYLPYYDNYNNCNVLKDAVSNTYLSPWTYTPTV